MELNRPAAKLRGLLGLMRGRTVTESFYHSPAMYEILRRMCGLVRFDAVVAFSSSMAPYALRVPARRRVLDLCDCDSEKWFDYAAMSSGVARRLYRMEGRRLAQRERAWLVTFDATLVITEAEAAPLKKAGSTTRLHVLGNGVNVPDMRQPVPSPVPTVGFVGVMDYRPNVDAVCWFADECWGAIREAHPEAAFRIVGRCPTRRVRRLSRIPGVQVIGGVDDIGWELSRFDVSVAPMRIARGLQNKVLEAMACSKPVVLTSRAAEGIEGRSGRDYLIADSAEAIIRDVRRLLRDSGERERIGEAARRYVADHHRWEDMLDTFELLVFGERSRSTPAALLHPLPARDAHSALVGPGSEGSVLTEVDDPGT